jgi:hypothetical protein
MGMGGPERRERLKITCDRYYSVKPASFRPVGLHVPRTHPEDPV